MSELVDELWGEAAPETATKALQGYVSQLRKTFGADRVETKPPGYSFRVADGELDLDRFEELVREGRESLAADDVEMASKSLGEALALWRGQPFAEFDSEPFARDAGARLEGARLAALEDRIEADLALGRDARLVPELEELVAREPYRERLRAQLMLALYRSGRQAEALDVYRRTRETLVAELGIEPSEELQELERAILRHDSDLDVARPPRPRGVGHAVAEAVPVRRTGRFGVVLVAAAAVLALVGTAAALVLTREGSSGEHSARDAALAPFVVKMENFLVASREGRREVSSAIDRASRCVLSPDLAVRRLNGVERNRQSLLQQVAALSVPNRDEALRVSDLFQQAIQASIAADWHYRDWLVHAARCPPAAGDRDFAAARRADAQATRAKTKFVAAFNPLAQRFHQRRWSAGEF